MQEKMVRTRVAVSPTGYPHIGTIYQALFDYAYARRNHGKFIVRIEDTDRERFVPDAQEKLFYALDWFGILEDESPRKGGKFAPYIQSERLPLYKKYADELVKKGNAYYCFCSKERLEEVRQRRQAAKLQVMYDKHCRNLSKEEIDTQLQAGLPKVIRLKVPENQTITVHDEIRGDISFDSNVVDDQVLLKSDGYPTYHLAVVVDDHFMEITDVVRGEEWLPSFPKQKLVYDFLAWQIPKFYHTSALRNADHSKLSKRQGHTNVSWYQHEGYLPEAILNYIALLGWSAPNEKEIFSLEEFVQMFDLKDIKPIGPVFDLEKLQWINGEYIRQLSDSELKKKLITFFESIHDKVMLAYLENNNEEFVLKVVGLAKTRIKTLLDFQHIPLPLQYKDPQVISQKEKEIAKELYIQLKSLTSWNEEEILTVIKSVLKTFKIRGNIVYKILTGAEKGLPLPESLALQGKEITLKRLEKVIG